ncbi:Cyclopropane-fatty-acyl-phospholipid synthase [Orchesella cincta]|uniref:Cyclopropane-fatty-acyl-phospholipid synthase n=1 Tax=Orchesella cincta TaxID=48709 RepID=A0A1D2MQ88_ORCCI|nr:Cyclopropane-fatty-acyl-phospholipid synthase [Orchesella cincta]
MSRIVDFLYALTLALIRTYKFCEFGLLKLFTRPLRSILLSKGKNLGIICHLPEQSRNKFSKEEEKRILKKCGYSTLIHVKINNVGAFALVANRGSLAIGEEYMNGGWEVMGTDADVSEVFYRILVSNVFEWYFHPLNRFLLYLEFKAFNLQTEEEPFKSRKNTMIWYLAENYGVECVGISVSKEGVKYAKKKCEGLNVELRVQDYRDLNEKFDRIVSIECLFHLGRHNHGTFFKTMNKCLKDDGILLLQVIGTNHKNMLQSDPFTHKIYFPNTIPYYRELTKETEGLFIMEDWHSFGLDFVRTLDAWQERFQQNWDTIKEQYDERFYKLWNYNISYVQRLLNPERVFTARKLGVLVAPKVSQALREAVHLGFDFFINLEEERNAAGLKNDDFAKLSALTLKPFDANFKSNVIHRRSKILTKYSTSATPNYNVSFGETN